MTRPSATILTLALGRRFYLDLAIALARSFLRFHSPRELAFRIVTDRDEPLPPDLAGCEVLRVEPGRFGTGFGPKLHLDQLAPEGRVLFLDSDILIYEPLDRLLAVLAGKTVAVVGSPISQGEWFGDVAAYCRRLGVPAIPKFNGGLYYFENGPAAAAVFARARELALRYDELGLVRLRGHPNDELVIAGAMALHGLSPLPDDGSWMGDPLASPGPIDLDVLRGHRVLVNPPPPSPLHREWNPFPRQSPALVHFLGEHALLPRYRTEAQRLRLAAAGWPVWIASLLPAWLLLRPRLFLETLKNGLRPAFRALFGTRRVKATPRETASGQPVAKP